MGGLKTILVLSAALMCVGAAWARPPGVLVSPVLVEIPAARGMGSLRVENGRAVAVSFEVDAYRWSQNDGADTLAQTRDIAVAPSVFELAPGQGRIVRIAMAPSVRTTTQETAFRLIVRELPPESVSRTGPTILLELSVPVFATVRGCTPTLNLARADGSRVTLANTGCAHARLLELGAASAVARDMPRYLLAGAGFTRAFPEIHDALRVVYAATDSPTEQVLRLSAADPSGSLRQRER